MDKIIFDFNRPIGRPCEMCGYPFGDPTKERKFYPLRINECPKHMPDTWKYHARVSHDEALAIDRAIEADRDFQTHKL